jgi:hypothetical protein
LSCIGSINADIDFVPIQDPLFAELIQHSSQESPLIDDDSSNDALTALATVASYFSTAPTAKGTPVDLDKMLNEVINSILVPSTTPWEEVSSHGIKMTILADAANIFVPTPIKVTSLESQWGHAFWSENVDCCLDDGISVYSLGSLSSPMKLLLPSGDRSAFTPVVASIDKMVADFCESYDSLLFNDFPFNSALVNGIH